ncbi:hypothetical protein BD560DRAFT_387251 [Blakeslea trispora]|nr:hypothetical protein BD560DRAFT_387251 [Blakeslea trispora]
MSQGITTVNSNDKSAEADLNTYQNYFLFSPISNMENSEKRKNLTDVCVHCQKANLICDKGRQSFSYIHTHMDSSSPFFFNIFQNVR